MIMVEGSAWGNQYNYLEPYTFSPNWGLVYNAHRYGCSTSPYATNPDQNQINELGNLKAFSDRYQVNFIPFLSLQNNSFDDSNIFLLRFQFLLVKQVKIPHNG